jgi:hypothetical protein
MECGDRHFGSGSGNVLIRFSGAAQRSDRMGDGDYLLARADECAERARLRNLEAWLDPITVEHLEATGIAAGWRCLEVGAGGGSIARWLSERVAPSGSLVATDITPGV